jgi:hypothetical protein
MEDPNLYCGAVGSTTPYDNIFCSQRWMPIKGSHANVGPSLAVLTSTLFSAAVHLIYAYNLIRRCLGGPTGP